jgi:molybdate transport system substrate-binding protein
MKRWLLVLTLFVPGVVPGQEIKIAAASDLTAALTDLANEYKKATGKGTKLSFGSSGNFFAQIENGAPFDLFFSADIAYPQKLEADGLIEPGSLYEYAVGRLVLLVPRDSEIDVNKGLQVLSSPAVRKISIANPQHAPYGRAAVAALQYEKLYDAVRDKLVFGENISQAAQFVQSHNADAGLIALSLALSMQVKNSGKYWLVPADFHPPLRQAVVILKSSVQEADAKQFLDFVRSEQGRAIMERYGFEVPEVRKK